MRVWRHALYFDGVGESQLMLINRTDTKQLAKRLVERAQKNYRRIYPRVKAAVSSFMAERLRTNFYANGTVQSCLNGVLRGDLGLVVPEASLETILLKMISTIQVNVSAPKSAGGVMQIKIQAVRSDFEDLLSLAASSQDWTDRNNQEVRGEPLPWLEWLLLEGGNVIIQGYSVSRNHGQGRSGENAIMVESTNPFNTSSRFWKVPAEFQGTATDNFILDIVAASQTDLEKKLWQIVRPAIAQAF